MISIVVCSINKEGRTSFAKQLELTIGVEHELIMVPNDVEKLSICAAYNKGAAAAKYPNLCFIHEDVTFHTASWGAALVENLRDKTTGFLGLAGSTLKTRNPSPWWITHENLLAIPYRRVHYIQSGSERSQPVKDGSLLAEVLLLDGFFMACTAETWSQTRFDEKALTGFHFYDMDICMAAHARGLKNYVYSGVLIEHHSTGSLNKGWVRGAEAFQKKWQPDLPACIGPLPQKDLPELERLALVDYVNALISNGFRWLSLRYMGVLLFRHKKGSENEQVLKFWLRHLFRS